MRHELVATRPKTRDTSAREALSVLQRFARHRPQLNQRWPELRQVRPGIVQNQPGFDQTLARCRAKTPRFPPHSTPENWGRSNVPHTAASPCAQMRAPPGENGVTRPADTPGTLASRLGRAHLLVGHGARRWSRLHHTIPASDHPHDLRVSSEGPPRAAEAQGHGIDQIWPDVGLDAAEDFDTSSGPPQAVERHTPFAGPLPKKGCVDHKGGGFWLDDVLL